MVDDRQSPVDSPKEQRRCTAPSPLQMGAVGLFVIAALAGAALYLLG